MSRKDYWWWLLVTSSTQAMPTEELEYIEVTAQFRVENVQKVPIPTSILHGEKITSFDIHEPRDIAYMVPGMTFAEFAPGQALTSMRGIVSADDGAGIDNSITFFLDGVYIGRLANVNFDLFDIERIEVLRGPQGTLFGRNAIGGAINVITKSVDDEFAAKALLARGNYNFSQVAASITGSLTDDIAGRLAINQRRHDGFTRNVVLNEDNQNEDTQSVRGQLQWLSLLGQWRLSWDYTDEDSNDMGRTPIANGNFDYRSVWQSLGGGPFTSTSPISGFSSKTAQGVTIQGETDFQYGQLVTILGWRDSATDWEMASVGAPLGGNYDLANGIYGTDVNDDIIEDTEQNSVEFRWNADLEKELNYTFGVFFLQENTKRIEQYKLDYNSTSTGQITVGNEVSEQYNQTNSLALYTQWQWQFQPNWLLTIGGRLTRDRKHSQYVTLNCGHRENDLVLQSRWCDSASGSLGILQQSFTIDTKQAWQDFSPKLAVQYSPQSNWMIYTSITRGFKSGGFPGSPGLIDIARQSISPETAINYEAGFKSDLADNTLRLNASVFYTDYRDLQVSWFGPSENNPGFGSFVSTNISESVITGGEIEYHWLVNDYLSFSGYYAYLDTQVKDFVLDTFAGEADLSGSHLRQAPRHKSAVTCKLQYPLGSGRGQFTAQLNYQFTDEQLSDYINQDVILEAHELVDVRIGWQNQQETIAVSLWAKNLFDETYFNHAYVIGPGIIGTWGAPKQIGITMNLELD